MGDCPIQIHASQLWLVLGPQPSELVAKRPHRKRVSKTKVNCNERNRLHKSEIMCMIIQQPQLIRAR